MRVKFKKLSPEAKIPAYALEHDAGMDIFCLEPFEVAPGQRALVGTGVASEIEPGYVALVWDKSGVSNNRGLKVLGGVIDAGYRGEWMVGLHNLGNEVQTFDRHSKIAQALIQRVEHAEIIEVEALTDSERNDGGFGSTGA